MPYNELNNSKVTNCNTEKISTLNLSLRTDHTSEQTHEVYNLNLSLRTDNTSEQIHEVYNLNYRSEKANGFPGHDGGNGTERCSAY